jgi:hypothetical protein
MAPPLPRPVGRRSFLKQTVAEWESWPWDTWNPSQAAHAARTIVLIDDLNRAATAAERIKLDQAVRQALRVLGLTKTDDDEDEETIAARRADDKITRAARYAVIQAQDAIRTGSDQPLLSFRDREGNLHDLRNLLISDAWEVLDTALEDERQQQAEADGTWPELTVNPDAPTGIPSSKMTEWDHDSFTQGELDEFAEHGCRADAEFAEMVRLSREDGIVSRTIEGSE